MSSLELFCQELPGRDSNAGIINKLVNKLGVGGHFVNQNDKTPPKRGFVWCSMKYYFIAQPVSSDSALPISASERTVLTPASSSAANFSSAVPLPPEMIAPA